MIARSATLPAALLFAVALGAMALTAADPAAAETRSKESGVLVLRGGTTDSEEAEKVTKVAGVSVIRPDTTLRKVAAPEPLPYVNPAAAPGATVVGGDSLWLVDPNRQEVITCYLGWAYYTGPRPIVCRTVGIGNLTPAY